MKKVLLITLLFISFFACKETKSGYAKSGCIEGDCQNGYGTILYTNGGTKTGNFIDGKLNGYGEIVWGKGKFEGNKHKGNFENGIAKGDANMYISAFDATFVGTSNGKYNMDYADDPPTGHFKVFFGENSLWEGTFEGDFVDETSKEWEERVSITHAKEGKYVAKNAGLFSSAIFCFSQYNAVVNYLEPLLRVYDKDLTTEIVSNEEIRELYDSSQSLKKILTHSLSRLNQLEEFDKKIPVKAVLCELFNQLLIRIDENMPKLLVMLEQPPSEKKLRDISYYNKPFEKKYDKIQAKYSKTYKKFENKHILF